MPTPEKTGAPMGPATLVACDRPRAPPVRIGVIADPHLATRAVGTWKAYHRTESLLTRAVDYLADRNVDRVLVLGDLTKDGEPWNFDRVEAALAALPVPVDAIPGNHDVPKAGDDHETPPPAAFRERFAPDGYPLVSRAGPITLVSLDTASLPDGSLRDTWAGAVSRRQLDRLDDVLAVAEVPIVACHHTLFGLPDRQETSWQNFRLRNADELLDVLAAHDVSLVLSGHHHVPATTSEAGVREVILPALSSFPQAVGVVDVGPAGTSVEMHPVATPAEMIEAYLLATGDGGLGSGVVTAAARQMDRVPFEDG